MEAIKNTVTKLRQNERMQMSPVNQQTSTLIIRIDREKHVALFQIINKARMLNGWTAKTAQELDSTIQVWAEILDVYQIPIEHYETLYRRAIDLRQARMANGLECPGFTAELLLSCWTGSNGLKAELDNERINAKRFLPETAESNCPRCFGKGMEFIYDNKTGRSLGVKPNCDHRPLQEGEFLWEKMRNSEEKDLSD